MHVLKNIMIPVVTVIGLEFGSTIAFSVVTESIFAWPGMGKLIIDSINVLDRPVIVAYLMIIVFLFVTINLIVDLIYTVLDPRVRLEAGGADVSTVGAAASRDRSGRRHVGAQQAESRRRSAASRASSRHRKSHLSVSPCSSPSLLLALLAPLIAPQNPYDLMQLDIMDGRLPPGSESMAGDDLSGSAPTIRAATCCRASCTGCASRSASASARR